MRHALSLLCILVCLLGGSGTAYGQTSTKNQFSTETQAELLRIKESVDLIEELTKEKILLDPAEHMKAHDYFLNKARVVSGRSDLSMNALMAFTVESQQAKQTSWQRFVGMINAVNTLWVLSILFGTSCLLYLARNAIFLLLELLLHIPTFVWNMLFHGFSVWIMYYGLSQPDSTRPYIGLTGTILLTGSLGWQLGKFVVLHPSLYSLLVTLIWTISALFYNDSMLGSGAVEALFATLGFSLVIMPGVIALGFEEESFIPRATVAAFFILALFIAMHTGLLPTAGYIDIFKDAAFWHGSLVTAFGLLILSSKWYTKEVVHYVFNSAATFVFAVALIFIGEIWSIPDLPKVGYWLIVLFLTAKYWEIPFEQPVGFASLGLIFSGIVYTVAMYFNNNRELMQQYFIF